MVITDGQDDNASHIDCNRLRRILDELRWTGSIQSATVCNVDSVVGESASTATAIGLLEWIGFEAITVGPDIRLVRRAFAAQHRLPDMDFNTTASIYDKFRLTTLVDLKADLMNLAVRYARIRVDWLAADAEKQSEVGEDRARAHDAFIAACDILGRNMQKQGEDASWRHDLGNDRKRTGDFACYLHCILGLSAR
jgi:hypothetical protein